MLRVEVSIVVSLTVNTKRRRDSTWKTRNNENRVVPTATVTQITSFYYDLSASFGVVVPADPFSIPNRG